MGASTAVKLLEVEDSTTARYVATARDGRCSIVRVDGGPPPDVGVRDVVRVTFFAAEEPVLEVSTVGEASSVSVSGRGIAFDLGLRCLIGNRDALDRRSRESALMFSGRLVVRGAGEAVVEQFRVADSARRDDYAVANLREGLLGRRDPVGRPSSTLAEMGVGDGWHREPVHVRAVPSAPPASRAGPGRASRVIFELRARRTGPDARLPPFGLRFATDDWVQVVQRPKVNTPADGTSAPWVLELSYSEPYNPPGGLAPNVDVERVLEAWSGGVAEPYLASIASVQGAERVTFVPTFGHLRVRWFVRSWVQLYVAADGRPASVNVHPGVVTLGRPTLQPVRAVVAPVRFSGFLPHDGEPPALRDVVVFNARLPDVTGPDDGIESALLTGMEADAGDGAVRFSTMFLSPGVGDGPPATYRLGSMDLTMGRTKLDPSTVGKLFEVRRVAVENRESVSTFAAVTGSVAVPGAVAGPPAAVEFVVRLPVARATPGGQDPIPSDRFVPTGTSTVLAKRDAADRSFDREVPVVVPLSELARRGDRPDEVPNGYPLVLHAEEQTRSASNRTLRLTLNERTAASGSPAPAAVVVLDRHPMTVATVVFPPFVGVRLAPNQAAREAANWDNVDPNGPHWEVRGLDAGYSVLLPPQAVGEAMEKFKTADRTDRPQPDPASDVDEGGLADFRFSPPAEARLLPYFRSRFAEAPWNLRRTLGYVGQRDPGARAASLRLELLYGLQCTISGNTGSAAGLRLTELSALLGNVPGRLEAEQKDQEPQGTTDLYQEHRSAWAAAYRQYLSRLGVILPRTDVQTLSLVLEDSLAFKLRPGADLRYPIPGRRPDPDSLAPNPGPQGLAGGVGWGFDSAAAYEQLWRVGRSGTGKLAGPALTALGGYGYQKAVFGLTTIHSTTYMGRLAYYSLERIGRVGNCYHLAKHVVVYERTTVPSDQFVYNTHPDDQPETDPNWARPMPRPGTEDLPDSANLKRRARVDDQDLHLGRPLLRKVREYVEILEPTRAYPDKPTAAASSAAFVRSIEFKSTIIAVNPKRLRDVRVVAGPTVTEVGYTIPLWHPDDEADKPTVYPRPQVLFRTAPGAGGEGTTPNEQCDPWKLSFFSSTRDADANRAPADWDPVHLVDFVDVTMARESGVPAMGPDPEQDGSDPPAHEPGVELFTYSFCGAREPTNLVDRRAAGTGAGGAASPPPPDDADADDGPPPMAAVLDNVTMMRAAPVPESVRATQLGDNARMLADATAEVAGTARAVREAAQQIRDLLPPGGTLDGLRARVAELKGSAQKSLRPDRLRSYLGIGNVAPDAKWPPFKSFPSADDLCTRFRDEVKALLDKARRTVTARLDAARTRLLTAIDGIADKEQVTMRDARALIQNELDALDDLLGTTDVLLGRAEEFASIPGDQVDKFGEAFEGGVARLLAAVDAAPNADAFVSRLDYVGETIDRAVADLERAARRGSRQLELAASPALKAAAVAAKAFEAVRDAAIAGRAQWEAARAVVRAAIRAAQTAVRGKLTEFGDAVKAAAGQVATVRRTAASLRANFAEDVRKKVDEAFGTMAGAEKVPLDRARAAVTTLFTAVDQLLADKARQAAGIVSCDLVKGLIPEPNELLGSAWAKLVGKGADTTVVDRLVNALGLDAPNLGGLSATELKARLKGIEDQFHDLEGRVKGAVATYAPTLSEGRQLFHAGSDAIRAVRAFGKAPTVQGLTFSRDRVTYFLDEANRAVGMTPVVAFADRLKGAAAEKLRAMRLRIPGRELLDKLVPDALKDFDLSTLFPSFAGMELSKLFAGLKMPAAAKDTVRITQGFDREALRAWVNVDVDVPVPPAELFNFGPLKLRLAAARFEGHVRIEAEPSGGVKRTAEGAITGDWELVVGGSDFVAFTRTTLRYQDGRVKFDISPDRVKLAGVVQFLSELVASVGSTDSGFSVSLLTVNGLPAGISADLALPLPDTQAGVSGIYGLVLRAGFELRVIAPQGGFDFSIGVFFALARKTAPFTLTIFILGGGGYVEVAARYSPGRREVVVSISLAITASAMLAIAIGPVKGCVYFGIGITVDYQGRLGGPQSLAVGAMLLIRGEVDVAGLVSVCISLLLELQYVANPEGKFLLARGTLSIRVKICWCFTFKFSKSVEYTYKTGDAGPRPAPALDAALFPAALFGVVAGGDRQELAFPAGPVDAAAAYLDLFD